jgi:hypothetical protein
LLPLREAVVANSTEISRVKFTTLAVDIDERFPDHFVMCGITLICD